MRRSLARRQGGAALIAMVAIFALGASWYLVSRLKVESGLAAASVKARNVQVLNKAKAALIGYVATDALQAGETNPGALPCPEGVNFIGVASTEGTSAPTVGSTACASVGRLPWRTLGLDKLVDAYGEPLWYVVGPTWRMANTSTLLDINSNTPGDISVDGNTVVALIIAPGPAMNSLASTGCTARLQARAVPAPSMNASDYLECFNSGTLQFVTTAPATSRNDQIIRITVADIMPVIEAAVAKRIEREIVPALSSIYTSANWGGITAGKALYPYAAPFPSGVVTPSTSTYQGAAGTYQGLLPFNYTQGCNPATDPRCTTSLLAFAKTGSDARISGGGSIRTQSTCAWSANVYVCTGEYNASSISLSFSFNVTNVAMGLRALDLTKVTCTAVDDVGNGIPTQTVACSTSVTMQSNGSATFTVTTATLPDVAGSGWGTYANYMINIDKAVLGDHALLNSADATTGWFVRNEWYRLLYYATVQKRTAGQLPSALGCTAPANCLTVTTNTTAVTNRSAILILAGRSINGSARPSSVLADYLEFGNRTGAGTGNFEQQTVTGSLSNFYADSGSPNAYAIAASVVAGLPFQFKAANANTGASTFSTTATGAKTLRNPDGSALTASQLQANTVGEVTYDGTQFILTKRPFNDRVIVVDSN
jgi:hypothetical protein